MPGLLTGELTCLGFFSSSLRLKSSIWSSRAVSCVNAGKKLGLCDFSAMSPTTLELPPIGTIISEDSPRNLSSRVLVSTMSVTFSKGIESMLYPRNPLFPITRWFVIQYQDLP